MRGAQRAGDSKQNAVAACPRTGPAHMWGAQRGTRSRTMGCYASERTRRLIACVPCREKGRGDTAVDALARANGRRPSSDGFADDQLWLEYGIDMAARGIHDAAVEDLRGHAPHLIDALIHRGQRRR